MRRCWTESRARERRGRRLGVERFVRRTLGHAVALAYLRPDLATPGTNVEVDTGRRMLAATVTPLPFYRGPSRAAGSAGEPRSSS